jgi:hypothetical protein
MFDLCVACCRWPADGAANANVRALADGADWDMLLQLARRHRVEGLVSRALQAAGVAPSPDVAASFASSAQQIARQNLMMAGECLALNRQFGEAGIPLLFIKGLTLSVLVYGDLAAKKNWDIDLLILPKDLEVAAALLEARGYRLAIPADSRDRLAEWHRRSKESVWNHPNGRFHVELHTELTDSPFHLTGIDANGPVQQVDIGGGRALPTFSTEALFAYLPAHGASSGWFRLKWIADFAALLASADSAELSRLHEQSQQLGSGRAADLALLLADRLFGLPLADDLRARLGSDPVVRRMVDRSLGLMSGRTALAEVTDVRFGTVPIHRIQFAMRPGWRYKAGLLRSKLRIRFF